MPPAACPWAAASWGVLSGHFRRQQKAPGSKPSRAFAAGAFSPPVLEVFPRPHWQETGGDQVTWHARTGLVCPSSAAASLDSETKKDKRKTREPAGLGGSACRVRAESGFLLLADLHPHSKAGNSHMRPPLGFYRECFSSRTFSEVWRP